MRIIEKTQYAYLDYLDAKSRGVSSTVRPLPSTDVESIAAHYQGPPAHIFWSIDDDDKIMRGWAVPYRILDQRLSRCAGLLGLQNPGLTYVSFPQGFGSDVSAWLPNVEIIGSENNNLRTFRNNDIETILITPAVMVRLSRLNVIKPSLRNIVIFVGCEFTTLSDIETLKLAFPGVNILICYFRTWTGIISILNAQGMTANHQAGLPIDGMSVQIQGGQLLVSSNETRGIRLITRRGETDFTGQWVPTRNRGSIEAGGGLIVSGYVT